MQCAADVQMISSISGAVLDTFTLTKPAGFKPDLAGRTAFVNNFKQTYFPGQNYPANIRYIEQTGEQALTTQQRHKIQFKTGHMSPGAAAITQVDYEANDSGYSVIGV